ncbi:microtubule-associated protein 1S [Suncus etruscus]|uniref:microtubule-associated protein 1S n=1 Tax=Suncus etruscus TaxID=109475 RepID=UPI002110A8D5|nr:microtubule-associated protein 1S [Suncus etruscus]
MAAAGSAPAAALLAVVGGECGECGCPELLSFVLAELERGIRSWDLDPAVCSLDEQLKAFVARHSATFSSIVRGQRSLHHRGDALETLVLLNPSDKSLCEELRNLLLDPTPHKLLVLAGPCLEQTGELLLQSGGFSARHFLQVLGDREIVEQLAEPPRLTVTCPQLGDWALLATEAPGLRLNPPQQPDPGEGLRAFLASLAETLAPLPPFELLEPPASVGFLRLARPCCYVFPGGLGDAAFFAVKGFTVLVNGGSNPKSSFWKLVRHLDRVDAVLVTHAGADSLPGLNSLLRRKVAERDQEAVEAARGAGGSPDARTRCLVSPELGVVFLNARAPATSRLLRGPDDAGLALSLLDRLGLAPLPLRGAPEPTVLFKKLGVGRLDMYVLHPPPPPARSSGNPAGHAAASVANAAACALLVWHPAGPSEKVVRVLFPGCTPPARLLDGLQALQHLGFLREPVVTPQDLAAPQPQRTESRESLSSREGAPRKEPRAPAAANATAATARLAQERPGTARKEAARKEPLPRRAVPEKKEPRAPPEPKKDPKSGAPRSQAREPRRAAATGPSAKKAGQPAAPPVVQNQNETRSALNVPGVLGGTQDPPPVPGPDALEPTLALPLQPCAPQPRSPSPAGAPQGLVESSGRLSLSPTVTTPSLPAEVSSPHSTEVDESLSMSFEQALPAPSGDAGLSLVLRGPGARRSASPHDVDLCLVSPCEFQHRRVPGPAPASPGSSTGSSAHSQDRAGDPGPAETAPCSVSESLPTLSDSDPPHTPGPADSDDDDDTEGLPALPCRDPLQCPPLLPTPPGICMVDPEILAPAAASLPEGRGSKGVPTRPHSGPATAKCAPGSTAKGKVPAGIERGSRPRSAQTRPSVRPGPTPLTRKASAPKVTSRGPSGPSSSRATGSGPSRCPIYLDLAYLPSGGSAHLLDEEFFRRVRALCYVISGRDQRREEGLRAMLDALLAAKPRWERDLQVTLIPTFDSVAMHEWYEETHTQHPALGITVLGSNSTVSMQDEAFPACKVEF